ncbi:TIGR00341 family protein [Thermus thermophilus]|uniref:TIGR00341 family protein n=1 Tax=Thermus thermophilus JL-18 TaxID=798128 RepID=H9ZQA1_THETH|nr:TIGR00341 family protein [Thermus thermophilus]AFH38511.1 TIGR00341 family protein [Thermus thermophilus JL-18]
MVIAPLLGPAMALALGSALGDLDLFRKAFRTLLLGVALASGLSLALGFFLPVDPSGLAPRTRPGLEDVAVALAAGVAGALGFTTGAPAALVGVMVAVALLPPLTAAGLLSGAGYPEKAFGAVLLFAVNVASVNLAGVATFLLQRVRPRTFWEAERAARASRTALLLWGLSLALLAGLLYLAQRVLPGF